MEEEVVRVVCDADCVKGLEGTELVTLPSGLQYKDIVVGKGPTPPTGYQVGGASRHLGGGDETGLALMDTAPL